jgi:hypothetical protein
VCDFLYEGYQNNAQTEINSFATAPKIVLNEIFTLLKTFYPEKENYVTALSNLEFIDILIKKICYLAYSEGIPKKIG